jgi:hypothetical protein
MLSRREFTVLAEALMMHCSILVVSHVPDIFGAIEKTIKRDPYKWI